MEARWACDLEGAQANVGKREWRKLGSYCLLGKPKEGLRAMLASEIKFLSGAIQLESRQAMATVSPYGSAEDKVFACLGKLNDHTTIFTTEDRES